MPWTASDAHTHIKGLSEGQASAWATIANSALAECQKKGGADCDGYAIRVANAKAKQVGKAAAVELIDKTEKPKSAAPARQFVIAKIDEAQRLVFGWASVAKDAAGAEVEDLQGDLVATEDLEPAVYDFVEHSRVGTDLHPADDAPSGVMVESLMVTPEKLAAMGLTAKSAPQSGWWTGFKFSPEAFAKVASGERRMFSIKGAADRVEA